MAIVSTEPYYMVCKSIQLWYERFLFNTLLYVAYLENLLTLHTSDDSSLVNLASAERSRLEEVVKLSLSQLVALGYPQFTIEVFHEVFFFAQYSNFATNSHMVSSFLKGILRLSSEYLQQNSRGFILPIFSWERNCGILYMVRVN